MTTQDVIQVILFIAILIGLTPILGSYLFRVFTGEQHLLQPLFNWFEKFLYKFSMNRLFQSMSAADFQACCVKMLIYRSIYQVGQLIVEVWLKEKLGSRI